MWLNFLRSLNISLTRCSLQMMQGQRAMTRISSNTLRWTTMQMLTGQPHCQIDCNLRKNSRTTVPVVQVSQYHLHTHLIEQIQMHLLLLMKWFNLWKYPEWKMSWEDLIKYSVWIVMQINLQILLSSSLHSLQEYTTWMTKIMLKMIQVRIESG